MRQPFAHGMATSHTQMLTDYRHSLRNILLISESRSAILYLCALRSQDGRQSQSWASSKPAQLSHSTIPVNPCSDDKLWLNKSTRHIFSLRETKRNTARKSHPTQSMSL